MRKTTLTLALATLLAGAPAFAGDFDQRAQESRAAIQQFAGLLQGELTAAMQAGGPTNAISMCRDKAPAIAAQISKDKGWDVARTSLKTRNTANAPDAWEQEVMRKFEARKAAGEDVKVLEHFEVVEQGGKKEFRYMKAIPTQAVCLTCHGAQLSPEVVTALDRLYPEDKARGFAEGDLRGAFTITQPM